MIWDFLSRLAVAPFAAFPVLSVYMYIYIYINYACILHEIAFKSSACIVGTLWTVINLPPLSSCHHLK